MKAKTRIYLIRHGEIAGSEVLRYNGQSDVLLTPKGLDQYHLLAQRLKDVPASACYTSDLTRCVQGAEILCAQREMAFESRRELRELSFGDWEGMAWTELAERFPEAWKNRMRDFVEFRAPGGENLLDLRDRVVPVIHQIVSRHVGEEVFVIGHGGVNRIILLDAMGAPPSSMFRIEQEYGCLNIIDYYEDGNPVVKLLNG
ncbi:MAG: alpha-ribazole phosphatase [Deltaproteobacteria bacterium]|nr:alpha-ribazole phosphatase [Deltaproteobacteria bacterium]TLN01473.1 MAG: alpha-ribazole phosphatase [bacterium]